MVILLCPPGSKCETNTGIEIRNKKIKGHHYCWRPSEFQHVLVNLLTMAAKTQLGQPGRPEDALHAGDRHDALFYV